MASANLWGDVWRSRSEAETTHYVRVTEGSGNPLAKRRADEQKHHIRLSLKARWPGTSKPRDLTGRVNDAVALWKYTFLSGEICSTSDCAIGIPTVFDRVIQQAIAQVISPIFDEGFSESSFGFRPKRSRHDAVKQLRTFVEGGKRIAVDVDLSKFFDRVNHDLLMTLLGRKMHELTVYLRGWINYFGVTQGYQKCIDLE